MGTIKLGKRHAFWWTPEFVSVDSLRSKNTLKHGKFLKFLKVTAKPKVLENLKLKVMEKVMEFEELERV